ncbi:hypothetical protein HRbin35_00309 [bacterium HR35]|nr:hypothetical protein HRbin35_00309 [bacterium HR35]
MWFLDFLALIFVRFVLAYYYFNYWKNKNENLQQKILAVIFISASLLLVVGYYTSFLSFFFLFYELFDLFKTILAKKDFTINLLKISLILVLLFIGPGKLSLDRLFNVRF